MRHRCPQHENAVSREGWAESRLANSQAGFAMRTVFESIVSVIGGEAAVRAASLFAALFIARVYGGFVLGAYAASLAVVTVFMMFADNGLQTFAITELSGTFSGRNKIVGQVYISKTILAVTAVALLVGVASWLKLSPFLWAIGAWVTIRTVLQSYSQLQMAILKSLSKANVIGVIQVIHSLFLMTGIWVALQRGWTVFALLAWFTAGQFFEFAMTMLVLSRAGLRPSLPEQIRFWAAMRKSTPFGITYGLATLIVRSDTVVLSTLVPLSVLGAFSAANSILVVVYVAGWLLGSVLLPEMVRLSVTAEGLRLYVRRWTRLLGFTTIPCALLAFLAAPKMMLLLFGPSLVQSGGLASVMVLACPFILLNAVYTNFAIAMNDRVVFTGLFAATAVIAIGLDIILGRAFGPIGVATAIVIREAGMLVGFWILMFRRTSPAAQVGYPVSS
jgi:O-antigen/teichoic acid export membrane protein